MEVIKMDWLKKLLKDAGIADTQIETIVANVTKEAPKHVVPKAKYNELSTAKSSLQTQLNERDKQLEELKKVDVEGLQAKIIELQQTNKTVKQEHEQQMKDERLNTALKLALHSKVHDTDLVVGLIDKAKIELSEDGKVAKGLDEQLKTLQESKSFLFVPESQTLPKGTKPAESKKGDKDDASNENYGKRIAEEVLGNTQYLADARKSYFQ